MKVRARVKAPEFIPDWAKCCPEFMAATQAHGEMTVDLSQQMKAEMCCRYCGTNHGETVGVRDLSDMRYIDLELLDLDEGPTA